MTSVRELRVLQQCEHPNLVELKKVVTGSKLDRYTVSTAPTCSHCDLDCELCASNSIPIPAGLCSGQHSEL